MWNTVLQVRPGLTGLAQLETERTFAKTPRQLELDAAYIRKPDARARSAVAAADRPDNGARRVGPSARKRIHHKDKGTKDRKTLRALCAFVVLYSDPGLLKRTAKERQKRLRQVRHSVACPDYTPVLDRKPGLPRVKHDLCSPEGAHQYQPCFVTRDAAAAAESEQPGVDHRCAGFREYLTPQVCSHVSSPSGLPAGRSQSTPFSLISTTSPLPVTHTPAAPCGVPSGTASGGCHDMIQSWPAVRIASSSPSPAITLATILPPCRTINAKAQRRKGRNGICSVLFADQCSSRPSSRSTSIGPNETFCFCSTDTLSPSKRLVMLKPNGAPCVAQQQLEGVFAGPGAGGGHRSHFRPADRQQCLRSTRRRHTHRFAWPGGRRRSPWSGPR